jgi:excisionase family DNA binding protein
MQSKSNKVPRKSEQVRFDDETKSISGGPSFGKRNKTAIMEADPVPLFDNRSTTSDPTIDLLTIADAAELLKISKSSVRRLQQGRRIQFFKVGGGIRFARSDIVSYLQKCRVEVIDK